MKNHEKTPEGEISMKRASNTTFDGSPLSPQNTQRSEAIIATSATTFIQADTSSFKQVVQMLTGSSESTKQSVKTTEHPWRNPISTTKTGHKKTSFKLYERRNSLKNMKINTIRQSTEKPEVLSPSALNLPSLVISPVTPLISNPFSREESSISPEERAIAEKKFYLHPSPISTPRDPEPRLLPLFPVTSPRTSRSA